MLDGDTEIGIGRGGEMQNDHFYNTSNIVEDDFPNPQAGYWNDDDLMSSAGLS